MHTLVFLLLVGVVTAGLAPLYRVDKNIKDKYVIKFKDDLDVDTAADDVELRVRQQRFGGRVNFSHRYHRVLKGVAVELPKEALEYVRSLDEVEYVSEDGVVEVADATWGLDRIDQRSLPLDHSYSSADKYNHGQGVEIWVLDTGIRPTHTEFSGRATAEMDANGGNGIDCNGHGTHCAGTAAGMYYGVANKATVKAVKIFGIPGDACSGSGSYSAIVTGLDYVVAKAKKPAVVSMSLGGGKGSVMDDAVRNTVAAGITVVVAAGNSNTDACTSSPAFIPEVITVGATNRYDDRAYYSNYGTCVDIFAPGSSIESAGYWSDNGLNTLSGTSMACPHVAGISALYLAEDSRLTPADVQTKLQNSATKNTIYDVQGSPNLLAYIEP